MYVSCLKKCQLRPNTSLSMVDFLKKLECQNISTGSTKIMAETVFFFFLIFRNNLEFSI